MTQIIYTSRTPVHLYQRCKRLRWLSTHEGEKGMGLEPKRKSIHLVVGGAVHSGLEVLLREGQEWLNDHSRLFPTDSLAAHLDVMFDSSRNGATSGQPVSRWIEDRAVAAALADLAKEMSDGGGVELDPEEQAVQVAKQANGTVATEIDMGGLVPGTSGNTVEQDSPIVIEFEITPSGGLTMNPVLPSGEPLPDGTYSAMMVPKRESPDQYLKEEISALCEGMIRAWGRRRWRGVLEQFEPIEVEREGEWLLGHVDSDHQWGESDSGTNCCRCEVAFDGQNAGCLAGAAELHFLSRHDALLLERSTGYLYLQSFKTTGSWDRRKEMDAQVDMQGLSEAVDVEQRFGEAHQLVAFMAGVEAAVARNSVIDSVASLADNPEYLDSQQRVRELVSDRVAEWLRGLPDPPQILGVRYEYLLKGSRRKDKKDVSQPDRWVQDSVLCRAWKQEGITSDDRRWAWTYDWNDETGKGRRLDYRSWAKFPVWKFMPIADWIDLLDQGKVQEGALREDGELMDALGEQFVPVIVQYRNRDETLDLLEQLEAQEVQVAKDVAAVREAEAREGYVGKRTELNRLFPQTRTACSYPGICQYRTTSSQPGFCFGAPDPFHDPTVLERFAPRVANHPQENNSSLVQISLDRESGEE
jgi:hypothetical protein